MSQFSQYLTPTFYFDFDHPVVQAFADKAVGSDVENEVEMAVRMYNAVRDEIRYNPYNFRAEPRSLSASYCIETGESYCIPKAVLLGALARYKGIPSRLGLANVKNHLSSQQLIDFLQSEVFVMHGYIELYLEGQWVKATPAFNTTLCEKMGVDVLDFDGRTDSIFQEYNDQGEKHMEYLADHGTFDDVPLDFIVRSVSEAYPHLVKDEVMAKMAGHSLESDIGAAS